MFNHTERTCAKDSAKSSSLIIPPRSGKTDPWVKYINEKGKQKSYYGTIYDMNLVNSNTNAVSEWRTKIIIQEDCYINNAWCGKMEIHQMVDGVGKSQMLDLRRYNVKDIKLKYRLAGNDLMIPLSKGDYIIYYPDYDPNEYPIPVRQGEKVYTVVPGIIFYKTTNTPMNLDGYTMYYHLEFVYTKSPMFIALLALCVIWIICICDSFDAMNSQRCYRAKLDKEYIIN